MTAPTLGFAFASHLEPERLASLARAVEAAGLEEVWVWEEGFKSAGIASAAIALGATSKVRVGIGALPASARNVAVLAMELATLARAYPGRLVPAVASGAKGWIARAGESPASPLTLLTEYVTALRALLDGGTVTVEGRYVRLQDVALDHPPTTRLPLFVGGGGPKALALSGRAGDGTILSLATPAETVRSAASAVRRARGDEGHPVVASLIIATGADAHERARRAAAWNPHADESVWAAGGAATLAEGIMRLADAGATSVQLVPADEETDLAALVALVGREVRPLLH